MKDCTRLLWSSIAVLVFLPILCAAQSDNSAQQKAATGAAGLAVEYQDWLDQDVHWIISDEERREFVRLSTNEERDRFVEQFWTRRDTSPGTTRNTFKEEHYRRIAYSNVHFGSAAPGWSTDRGRIYVLYGAPDEVLNETTRQNRTQLWRYRSIQGQQGITEFRFVDACRCGSYALISAPVI